MNRRSRTVVWGAIPVLAMTYLASAPAIPFTNISLTVPYAAEGPGPTYNTLEDYNGKPIVNITGTEVDPTTGHLNMTTVVVRTQLTLSQALTRWLINDDTLVPIEQIFPPTMTPDEVNQQNQTAFTQSESAATLAAMNYLKRPTAVEVVGMLDDAPAKNQLGINDRIASVDGHEVTEPAQIRDAVQAKKPGDHIDIGLANGEKKSIQLGENPDNKQAFLGITMGAVPADGTEVEFNLEDIGGPSAGLMFTLAVVDKLSPGELTGGKFIAGTGTIAEDGTVGPIGGIEHKVQAAKDAGAEVFLAPGANCAEAVSRDHGDVKILKVDTLTDAITQLENYNSGAAVTECQK